MEVMVSRRNKLPLLFLHLDAALIDGDVGQVALTGLWIR
jgi:hypothetical protein